MSISQIRVSRVVVPFASALLAAGLWGCGEPRGPADLAPLATTDSIAQRYREPVARIATAALASNEAYRKLEELCDGIGHRLSGSPQLDRAITWAAEVLRRDGAESVRLEQVSVPCWVRGGESLDMLEPRSEPLAMLGLGGSVGTPPEGITAEVVSVRDEAELDALAEGARGKIVLFDNAMPPYDPDKGTGYGTAVRFRSRGAQLAAEKGAVACLIRSVTARSFRSPHTGAMRYGDAKVKIPAAAITTEDAAMISRLRARDVPVVVTLKMEARTLEPALSANVVGELRGSSLPEQIVVIGGHIDSWDVGQGAHDDGGGCVMVMEAINVLRRLELIPRRTIRVVLWTNEENGLAGARAYAKDHADELAHHVAAIEADAGVFRPTGYVLECSDPQRQEAAAQQMGEILSLLAGVPGLRCAGGEPASLQVTTGGSGADLSPLKNSGIVLLGHMTEQATYFDYHHSPADTLDKVDPQELSENVAVLAAVAYVIADMPDRLGHVADE